jgi:hypothetical protein
MLTTVAIDNERTKLAANALDRSSTACLAVGIFAPLAALLQGQTPIPVLGVAMSFVGWLAAAIVTSRARRVLGVLKQ